MMSGKARSPTCFECFSCHHVAPVGEFGPVTEETNHTCPKCGSDEAVFPFWRFRCIRCGGIYDAPTIFGSDTALDFHPHQYMFDRQVLRDIDGCPTEYSWDKSCGCKLFVLVLLPPSA
jgi:hypothetical protein